MYCMRIALAFTEKLKRNDLFNHLHVTPCLYRVTTRTAFCRTILTLETFSVPQVIKSVLHLIWSVFYYWSSYYYQFCEILFHLPLIEFRNKKMSTGVIVLKPKHDKTLTYLYKWFDFTNGNYRKHISFWLSRGNFASKTSMKQLKHKNKL